MKNIFLIFCGCFFALATISAQTTPSGNHQRPGQQNGNNPSQNVGIQLPGHPQGNHSDNGQDHHQGQQASNPPAGSHPNLPPQGNHPGMPPHGNPPGQSRPPYINPLPGQVPPPIMPGHIVPPGQPPYIAPNPCTTQNYYNIKSAIAAQNFENGRLHVAQQLIPGAFLTAKQLASIAKLFNFESTRLEFLKFSYIFCYNPQQYFLCERTLNFNSSKKALREYINRVKS